MWYSRNQFMCDFTKEHSHSIYQLIVCKYQHTGMFQASTLGKGNKPILDSNLSLWGGRLAWFNRLIIGHITLKYRCVISSS